ncbi:MAG: dodecin family protein, partial [Candidatus Thiodiazotropha sp.]|nr:dodecin family protein [Candidatus Thiodiazotropha sp.]
MSDHVYKKIQLVGSSSTSTDDAIRNAIARASETINNM